MAPWKAKCLSFMARLTLTKSVAASLPVYNMQTEMIPNKVGKNIDKMNRDFIWGDEPDKSKMHLVAWEKMTTPKCQGGVGLRPTRLPNLAMLAKGGWRLMQEKDTLWTQVMQAKYGRQRQGLSLLCPVQGSSFTWTSFSKAIPILENRCVWNIKNGRSTKFWNDPWVLQVPLRDMALDEILMELEEATVADFAHEDGSWRTELFSDLCQGPTLGRAALSTQVSLEH
ncbi:unnamed protein product [Linum trigynum]|uniref:Uncharacterized protein n=1 Tax=Linum trigynum TaxID=586398 RepID=A0AAV2GL98_9ROSI